MYHKYLCTINGLTTLNAEVYEIYILTSYKQGWIGPSRNREIPDGSLREMLINIYCLKEIK